MVNFIYSEKATKFCKISTLLLPNAVTVKCKVEILQKFVAFSKYELYPLSKSDLGQRDWLLASKQKLGKSAVFSNITPIISVFQKIKKNKNTYIDYFQI